MTVIEKAARALAWNPIFADGLSSDADVQRWEDEHWPEFVDQARAVLTAIREPSEAMIRAGMLKAESESSDAVWQAMIDAAMAEEG